MIPSKPSHQAPKRQEWPFPSDAAKTKPGSSDSEPRQEPTADPNPASPAPAGRKQFSAASTPAQAPSSPPPPRSKIIAEQDHIPDGPRPAPSRDAQEAEPCNKAAEPTIIAEQERVPPKSKSGTRDANSQ